MRSALRQAWRALLARPALTLGLALTLALGVGANAAMLRVLDVLLLRAPAHVQDPDDRLTRLWFHTPPREGLDAWTSDITSYPAFRLVRDSVRAFDAVAAVTDVQVPLAFPAGGPGDGTTHAARGVSPAFFAMLGARPALGRWLDAEDDRADAAVTSVVLGHELWRTRFAADPGVLGREVRLGPLRARIVGVAPPRFAGDGWARVALWLPIEQAARAFKWSDALTNANSAWLWIVARRAPGVPAERAAAEATVRWRAWLAATEPERAERIARRAVHAGPIVAARAPHRQEARRLPLWLAGTAGALLLAALANATGLLLARAVERRGEVALRRALGASPRALLRVVVAEATVLAAASATLAVAVAAATGALVRRHLLNEQFAALPVLDVRVGLAIAALAGGSCLGAAVAAAWAAGRGTARGAVAGLTDVGRGMSPAVRRTLGGLLGAQVALACVLAYGATLFGASLARALGTRVGYDLPGLVAVQLGAADEAAFDGAAARRAYARAAERVAALPGVARVALTSSAVLESVSGMNVEVPGRSEVPQLPGGGPYYRVVSGDYFAVTGTRLLVGRTPRARAPVDTAAPQEVVVSALTARLLWPDASPLGRCVRFGDDRRCHTVVGVAEDARNFALREDEALQFYLAGAFPAAVPPARSDDFAFRPPEQLLVRATRDGASLAPAIARALRRELPTLTVAAEPLGVRMERSYRPWRAGVALAGSFAALAVVLTAAGLFGAVSYALAQRRREVGVRLALGAPVRHVVALLARAGLGPVLAGLVGGGVLAAAASRAVRALLYETSPTDPRLAASAAMALLLVAALACWLPACRAARVDPAVALRAD